MEENAPLDTIIELKSCSIMQQDHLVLSDVNLKADRGEFLYLVGKVGSGKTSLIRTLNAQLPLTDGEGWVAGFDLKKLKKREIPLLRRKLGIVFQDFQLLTDRSVHDNLEFVLRATGWNNKTATERPHQGGTRKGRAAKQGLQDRLISSPEVSSREW